MDSAVPDLWLEVRVRVEDPVARSFVAERLIEEGARGVQEVNEGLVTHYLPRDDPRTFIEGLARSIRRAAGRASVHVDWRWQEHEDWETLWRQGLGPRRIGTRLVVRPSWTEYDPGPGDLFLTIDPGVAFGTTEHATTRTALVLLEARVRAGERVADVGTGTGVLAMAAALLGAATVSAFDVDPLACAAARENAVLNEVGDRVRIVEGTLHGRGPLFDGVLVNIEWVRLEPLLPTLIERVAPGGWMIVSGVLLDQREAALQALADLGLRLEEETSDEEWWGGALLRAGG